MHNKATIVGRLGQDPDVRYTQDQRIVVSLSVATTDSFKDSGGGQQARTEWHRVKLFGKRAEVARDHLKKGSLVLIEGSIRTSKYSDKKTGEDRFTTEIVADILTMLGKKTEPATASPTPATDTVQSQNPFDEHYDDGYPF
jgi:single-strand DNA-binding protein